MTVALVHSNPETAAVWDALMDALELSDVFRLSPPSFGAPVPAGWRAAPTAYRKWLIDELETIGTPVHLVGHDWGGAHVVELVGDCFELPDVAVAGSFSGPTMWQTLSPGRVDQMSLLIQIRVASRLTAAR